MKDTLYMHCVYSMEDVCRVGPGRVCSWGVEVLHPAAAIAHCCISTNRYGSL